ncbi:MAG: hypothetical protein DRQ39_05950 [Gammaproteobacteria bacterium]|nr:MAG: hypothetical protein DRQ39_05950 [Gammaproteobacteria bacterium]
MGVSLNSMTWSRELRDLVGAFEQLNGREFLNEAADMTSTSGYDNDGSTGPELLDNGVALAFEARDYDDNAVVFFGYGEDTCYYVFGRDESDAVRRLRAKLSSTEESRQTLTKADKG